MFSIWFLIEKRKINKVNYGKLHYSHFYNLYTCVQLHKKNQRLWLFCFWCETSFPYLVAIFAVVELLSASGLSALISKGAEPIFSFLGIPSELTEFLILRPFTGSGSIGMLSKIFATYGANSYVAKCACIIMSCSETTFYVVAVYFSTTKIKKLKYVIPVCLLSAFLGSIIACFFARILIF